MDCIEYNTVLIADLELLFDVNYPVVLSGDLNCADVNWINNTSPKDGVQDIILYSVEGVNSLFERRLDSTLF